MFRRRVLKWNLFVIITEIVLLRCVFLFHCRYYLKGPKATQAHKFVENLPGLPDNIRPSSSGGYWVGMAAVRDPARIVDFYDFAARRPWFRKFMTQVSEVEHN